MPPADRNGMRFCVAYCQCKIFEPIIEAEFESDENEYSTTGIGRGGDTDMVDSAKVLSTSAARNGWPSFT